MLLVAACYRKRPNDLGHLTRVQSPQPSRGKGEGGGWQKGVWVSNFQCFLLPSLVILTSLCYLLQNSTQCYDFFSQFLSVPAAPWESRFPPSLLLPPVSLPPPLFSRPPPSPPPPPMHLFTIEWAIQLHLYYAELPYTSDTSDNTSYFTTVCTYIPTTVLWYQNAAWYFLWSGLLLTVRPPDKGHNSGRLKPSAFHAWRQKK